MKPHIPYSSGRWHVTEPGGEVTWHFRILSEAIEKYTALAEMRAGKYSTVQSPGARCFCTNCANDRMDGAPK